MRSLPRPQVVGFGMLTPVSILIVDELPPHNTGAIVRDASEFIFDDAAIVACLMRQWNVASGLIGTTLGNDMRGRALVRQLKTLGVQGKFRLSQKIKTPIEVDVSDKTGARTYFWQRDQHVLDTLDTADLSLLRGAKMLYVDWYDGDHILRAMDEANRLNIPVFLNLEHGHQDLDILNRYVLRATICQAVTDPAQKESADPVAVARKLLNAGAKTALITLASEGSVAVDHKRCLRVYAPKVNVVDGCGAGATFSTGFIYGQLQNWNLEESVRFASTAASLKVARAGLSVEPVKTIRAFAKTIKVERIG